MRVLMLIANFRPRVGGAEQQAERLARALIARGAHVEILTPRWDPGWPERETPDGLGIRRFRLSDLSARFPRLRGLGVPNLWIQRRQMRQALRIHLSDFDLLHAHIAGPLVAFALGPAHSLAKPVLCKPASSGRGFDFLKLRRASVLGPLLERQVVAGVDGWVAISRGVREDLLRAGVADTRITDIPNGIDPCAFPVPRPRPSARRFLCLGTLYKFDLVTLLEAFDSLAAELPDVALRVAGRGEPELDAAKRRLERLPHACSRTAFVGVSPAVAELEWADALVHPSVIEGMSNTLLEAMCVGVPCVASDIVPNREVLGAGEAGLLVPLHDAAALAHTMRRLALEPALGPRLAASGRRRVETHYELRGIAERYLRLYGELLGRAEGARRS